MKTLFGKFLFRACIMLAVAWVALVGELPVFWDMMKIMIFEYPKFVEQMKPAVESVAQGIAAEIDDPEFMTFMNKLLSSI